MMITNGVAPPPLADVARRCRREQESWAALPVKERLRPVRELRRLLVRDHEKLCAAVADDIGKPPEESLAGEVLPVAAACKYLLGTAARALRPQRVGGRYRPLWLMGQKDVIHRRPRGLVGIIGTWNYPVYLNGTQLLHALTAGNGVIWKPSEVAPASAAALQDLFREAGYPTDLIQVLPATREAGRDLAEADVDHVVFTGSSATGRKLAETLGRRLVSSTLELSGCDALFVLDDADAVLAARAAWFGATVNRGQTCIAARRAFVHRGVYPAFVEALRPLAATGRPARLALESQVRQAERLVEDALAAGARLLETTPGDPAAADDECAPAVVLDARPDMALCREASFAPLLAVVPYDNLEDAVRMNGRCAYGLGASVFTAKPSRALRLAEQVRAGMVTVNDVVIPTAHPATPFGGVGESGWGVTQGEGGLLEMTVPQVVSVRGGRFRPHYDQAVGKMPISRQSLQGMLEMSHGRGFGARWRGFVRFLSGLRKNS